MIDTGVVTGDRSDRRPGRHLHNEEVYAVIDGTDGRAHHVGFPGGRGVRPAGGVVEVRRFGGPDDPRRPSFLAGRSDINLARQVTAPGGTWLDYRLVERERMPLAMGGFGQEVCEAIVVRAERLVAEGLARREGIARHPAARSPRHAAAA